eukprot:sb/3475975/
MKLGVPYVFLPRRYLGKIGEEVSTKGPVLGILISECRALSYYILSKLCDCDHLATITLARAIIRGTWRSPCRWQLGTKGKFDSARAVHSFTPVLMSHLKRYSATFIKAQENCCCEGAGQRK